MKISEYCFSKLLYQIEAVVIGVRVGLLWRPCALLIYLEIGRNFKEHKNSGRFQQLYPDLQPQAETLQYPVRWSGSNKTKPAVNSYFSHCPPNFISLNNFWLFLNSWSPKNVSTVDWVMSLYDFPHFCILIFRKPRCWMTSFYRLLLWAHCGLQLVVLFALLCNAL